MKVVSLSSQKGDVGKTTLATGLAVAARRDGNQVLLVDLDPQASAAVELRNEICSCLLGLKVQGVRVHELSHFCERFEVGNGGYV